MINLQDSIKIALDLAQAKYEFAGEGRTRKVFLKDEFTVLKFPKDDWGISDNYCEERLFQKFGKSGDIPFAKCKVIHDDNNIPILEMERVFPLSESDPIPDWAKYVDCGQIGKTATGEIVAFDFSIMT